VVTWTLGPNDEGTWESTSQYPSKTVQIEGAIAALEGRNRPDGAGANLCSDFGDPIMASMHSLTRMNPLQIRPVASTRPAIVSILVT
jgi:hypothetical protein